ncbi:unnamed protein product [Mytilus coruscus]|uniref:Uncharacterized protein n=1 Tax=Mytilus coruscus TaxID=42192 RepID=A0A6J8CWG9_MYTCO|nr:unnamed protein product [Mytilus coruscus]
MTYLKQLLKKLDLCCLQENWLFKQEQHLLHAIDTNMIVTAKSIDDENPELTSKELTQYVQILDMEPENTSDHVPVIATIKRKLVRKSNKPKSVINISEASKITKEKHALWKNGGAPIDKNNPLKSQLTAAKRQLRKAHRQAYASQREKLANQIMIASPSDNKLFHKLLRTQRSDENRFTKTLRRGNQTAETNEDILHMWTDYFHELSNPDYKQDFDYEKYKLSSLQKC